MKDFIKEFSSQVKRGYIFCSKNITEISDYGVNYTLWPNEPLDPATQICYKYDYWHGITVSKIHKDYAELWWFCGSRNNPKLQQFIASNKILLVNLINCFNKCLRQMNTPINSDRCPYTFTQGFDTTINSFKKHVEFEAVRRCILDTKYMLASILAKGNVQELTARLKVMLYGTNSNTINKVDGVPVNQTIHTTKNYDKSNKGPLDGNLSIRISRKEIEIISLLSKGLTYKIIANELSRSPRTVEHHIESIKAKLNLNCKTDIIKFFQDGFKK